MERKIKGINLCACDNYREFHKIEKETDKYYYIKDFDINLRIEKEYKPHGNNLNYRKLITKDAKICGQIVKDFYRYRWAEVVYEDEVANG